LVKYAEEFTNSFDLIAERKSVFYHLRELAKASVLAKYLLEAGVGMDELWFGLAEAKEAGRTEIPQLWNERSHSHFQVQDGQIVDSKEGFGKGTHSLYGGVQFGLDIFKIYSTHERQVQGVDLNLDNFSLDQLTKQKQQSTAQVPAGRAFFSNIDGTRSTLSAEDKELLASVFDSSLSDRRAEGERFVPPATSVAYMDSLRQLVKEESLVREQRREHFLSSRFVMGNAGPLFPSSWTASFRIERGHEAAAEGEERRLRARSDFKAKPMKYEHIMKTSAPIFDEQTEDGARFRIYKMGSLEVRTTQASGAAEEIGAVFSVTTAQDDAEERLDLQARVVKATEYVEPLPQSGSRVQQWTLECRSYVVLETDAGRSIMVEKLQDGRAVWRQDPADLEDRNSLAKVVRSQECTDGLTVGGVRDSQQAGAAGASASECRHYAQEVFRAVNRSEQQPRCGFRRQARGKWWLSGGTHVTKDKKRRTEKFYADKTFTVKFTETKDGRKYTKEQYKELKETLSFLLGVRGRGGLAPQEHEGVFNIRAR